MIKIDKLLRPKVLLGVAHAESGDAICVHLENAGCDVDRAQNISDCHTLLEDSEFDLLVLDVSLNGCDDIDVFSLYKNQQQHILNAPIVFAASRESLSIDRVRSALRAGAHDVLEMPMSEATLARLTLLARSERSEDCEQNAGVTGNHVIDALESRGRADANSCLESCDSLVEWENTVEKHVPHQIVGRRAIVPQKVDPPLPLGAPTTRFCEYRLNEHVDLRELKQILVGDSPAITAIQRLILDVAPTRATVMIYGESGTGKELVAQAIHRYSNCADKPFVPVNMAAIPHGLAESLLFGHEKGSFTNAICTQKGWCEAADQGTLFLDEIGDTEIQVQPKLLRFLQEGTVQRIGSQSTLRVQVRVITATNRPPTTIVKEGRLREDLYFRLHVVPIYIPPLRERRQDIRQLAGLFLRKSAERHERDVDAFSEEALRYLCDQNWPGNVRQLENVVERLVIFARKSVIGIEDISAETCLAPAFADEGSELVGSLIGGRNCDYGEKLDAELVLTPIQRHERLAIVDALRRVDGHVIDAARLLGLGQATMYRKIKQYAIPHVRKRRPTASSTSG